MKIIGLIQHILLTGIFLLSLSFTTSINSFGQCHPSTAGTASLSASWIDTCGSGGAIDITLTNNSSTTFLVFGDKFRIYQGNVLVHDTSYNGNANFTPYSTTVTLNTYTTDTFFLYILKNGAQLDTCDIDTFLFSYIPSNLNANFTMSSSQACTGDNVTFTNTSSGFNILAFDWDFVTSTATTVGPHINSYGAPNNYNIELIVRNACDTDTTVQVLTITGGGGGSLGFYAEDVSGNQRDTFCLSEQVIFVNTSNPVNNFDYLWSFGDGSIHPLIPGSVPGITPPPHSYPNIQNYTVNLSAVTGIACNGSFQSNIIIVPDITGLTMSGDDGDGDTRNCLPYNSVITTETVSFTANATGATRYIWDFGDASGIITTLNTNIQHNYGSYGTFEVIVIAENGGGCSQTDTIDVIFQRNPFGDITLPAGPVFNCTPYDLILTNNSLNGVHYNWDFGDGTTITTNGTVPTHTYLPAGPGAPPVFVFVGNECDTVASNIVYPILVNGPWAKFITDLGGSLGCVGEPVQFFSTSTGVAPPNDVDWNFGDPGSGSNNVALQNDTVAHTFAVADTFLVELIVGGGGCPDDTTYQNVIIYDEPVANFGINPSNGCVPTSATISNPSTGPNLNYEWWVNGVLISTDSLLDDSIFEPEINVYNIDLVASNHCEDDTMSITFTYTPTTYAEFTPLGDTTICQGETVVFQDISLGSGNTYDWDLDGNGVFGEAVNNNNPSLVYNAAGVYLIREIVQGTCGNDTDSVTVTVLPVPNVDITAAPTDICLGDTVFITDNSTPPGAISTWINTAATVTGSIPPKFVFTNSGSNYISLILAAGSCADTDSVFIAVRDYPIADIGLTTNAGCTPATFNFANNSTSGTGTTTYQWNFDNGNTSTGTGLQTQTYIDNSFVIDSVKSVMLVATSQYGCSDTTIEIITIHPTPDASFTLSSSSACANDPITFTNTSQPLTSIFAWTFGDFATSSLTSPTHQYAAFGAYEVILTASNAFACVGKDTDSVFVDPAPVAAFTFSDLCFGDSTLFIDASTGSIDTFIWDFDDAIIDTLDYIPGDHGHIYTATGSYNVSLRVINIIGCTDQITHQVDILSVPTADFNFSSVICEQTQTSFLDMSVNHDPILNYWDFGDATNIITSNPSHNYADTGFYDVLLVATNSVGCPDSITKTIWVDSIPTPSFATVSVCITDTTVFTNNTFHGADTVYWDFDDGTDTNTYNPKHIFDNPGPYNVLLVAGYLNTGCVDSVTIIVDAYERVVPGFVTDTICFKEVTQFSDTSLNTTPLPVYLWEFGYTGSVTSALQNPTHQYPDSAGYYVVKLTVQNQFGCVDSVEDSVFVKPLPNIGFISDTVCLGLSLQMVDTTEFAITWEWTFPDLSQSTNDTANYIFNGYGNHAIDLVVENTYNCFDTLYGSVYVDSIPVPNFTQNTACIFDTTFFNNLTPTGADTFFWDFGDGKIDSVLNPKHVYDTGGVYNVQLVAGFSGSSCFDSVTIQVISHQRSFPGFIADTVCFKELTGFTDTTVFANIVDVYAWDFDDNTPIDGNVNPTHQFPDSAGTYQVKLTTTTDSGCVDSVIVPITVNPLPNIGFTSDTVCPGLNTTLIDTTFDAISWAWKFGDLSTSAPGSKIELHAYPDSGEYYVQLIVFNSFNCRDTLNDSIYVYPRPTPGFTFDTACHSYASKFTDTSVDAVNHTWDFQDGAGSTSGLQNPAYTFTSSGIQTVELLVENSDGCMDSITKNVLVYEQPLAGFTSTSVCAGNSSVFTDTSTNSPNYWEWDFKDGSGINLNQNPSHTYSSGGLVNIELVVGNTLTGCYDTLLTQATVFTIPNPGFFADTSCLGNITTFTDTSSDPFLPITNWQWDYGDNISTSVIQSPTYIYQDSGVFNVSLTITNSGGCDSTVSKNVLVKFSPVADFTFDTVCAGALTTFTDLSSGPPTSWEWFFGDGLSSQTGPITTHSYKFGGQFFATLIVDLDGCIDQVSKVVDVFTGIVAEITLVDTSCVDELVFFADSSDAFTSTITSHNWYFGDANGSNSPHPKHSYAASGVYQVILIDTTAEGCVGIDTQNIYISDPPVANFSTANPAACSDQVTVFVDQSTTVPGQIVDWDWDFGDTFFDTILGTQNPSHQYLQVGNYNVELIVYNESGCSDTISKLLNVFDIPVSDFDFVTSCKGEATAFNDQSSISIGSITGWEWTFPDASTIIQSNSQYTFDTVVDTANVQLVVTSNNGCTDTITKEVYFHPEVVFDFRAVNASGCQPYNALFEDNSYIKGNSNSNITNWLWSFGDNNFAFPVSPDHIYDDSGEYQVTLEVTTSDGCIFIDTLGYEIHVHPKPIANFSCGPDSISVFQPVAEFTDLSEGGNSWLWSFGDGDSVVGVLNPNHEYPGPGEYLVSYTVTNNFDCEATASKLLVVEDGFDYHIPNAFTPNNDGKNDIFIGRGVGIQDMRMFIFGRGGEIIFESYSSNVGWNGTVKESKEKAKQDTYIYKIIVTDIFGGDHLYRGHVNLLK